MVRMPRGLEHVLRLFLLLAPLSVHASPLSLIPYVDVLGGGSDNVLAQPDTPFVPIVREHASLESVRPGLMAAWQASSRLEVMFRHESDWDQFPHLRIGNALSHTDVLRGSLGVGGGTLTASLTSLFRTYPNLRASDGSRPFDFEQGTGEVAATWPTTKGSPIAAVVIGTQTLREYPDTRVDLSGLAAGVTGPRRDLVPGLRTGLKVAPWDWLTAQAVWAMDRQRSNPRVEINGTWTDPLSYDANGGQVAIRAAPTRTVRVEMAACYQRRHYPGVSDEGSQAPLLVEIWTAGAELTWAFDPHVAALVDLSSVDYAAANRSLVFTDHRASVGIRLATSLLP
jgi:hypothetical protein